MSRDYTHQQPEPSRSSSGDSLQSRSNQLYMGDLDSSWDENSVRSIWASMGEPNVQVKMIRNTSSSVANSGYCFIEFPSHLNASNALLKNGLPIPNAPNKVLKLNWASFATAPGNEFSIFVGDLAPNVTESQLFELFISRYASTLNAKIVFDQVTGVSKGYGFVKFGHETEQQRALLEMQGVFLNGRAIRVSTTSKSRSKFQQQSSQSHMQSQQLPSSQLQSQFVYPVQQQPAITQFTDPNNTTVFIGGLSSLVTEDELRSYFQPFGSIVYVKIPVGKGCGFVQYVERISAETAIAKMQGFPIGNSRIRLSWGRSAKQAAAMQQAFASALQQQQLQQQQQRLQHQQILQQQQPSNLPYQPQPAMPTSYGYSSTWDSLNGNYMPMSQTSSIGSIYNTAGSSSNSLLAGITNLDYNGLSMNITSSNNGFNYVPSYSNSSAVIETSAQVPGPVENGFLNDTPSHPQIMVQGNDVYVKRKSETVDRLEKGSNGFIFA